MATANTGQIVIEVKDAVATNVASKFDSIAKSARAAHRGVTQLQQQIRQINSAGISALANAMSRAATAASGFSRSQDTAAKTAAALAIAQQRLATEQQRTATETERTNAAAARAAIENNKVATSAHNAAIAAQQLATAQAQTSTAQTTAARSAQALVTEIQRTATEQQRLATETGRTTTANNNAATAAARLVTEQQRLATETQKTATAQNNAATAAQRLQTETARTVTEQARLSTEQQRLATETQRTAAQQTNASTAQQRLATELNRTTEAHNKASLAAQKVATEYYRTQAASVALQQAQVSLATATQRLATEQQRTALEAQRVSTEQQRTAAATNRAAEAASRAALAALRLAQAEDEVAAGAAGASLAMGGFMGKVAALVGIGFGVSSVTQTADSYTVLQNRLSTVSTSQAQTNKLMEEMFSLADRTRSDVTATTEAFVRFDRALQYMGKSQEDTIRMTETINKAMQISGTNTQESAAALLQLSQAFNAGKLQGDEFRSVSENMPIVLDAVATVAGKTRQDIKQMAKEGKIDTEMMYNAFALMATNIDAVYAKLTPTVAQSMVVLRNDWKKFIGQINVSSGATNAIANSIFFLATHLKSLALAATIAGATLLVAFGPTLLTAIVAASKAVYAFTLSLASNPFGLLVIAITAATAALVLYGNELIVTQQLHATWSGVVMENVSALDYAKGAAAALWDVAVSAAEAINDAWSGMLVDVFGKSEALGVEWGNVFTAMYTVAKWLTNVTINAFRAMLVTVKQIFLMVVDAFNLAGTLMYNSAIVLTRTLVDLWIGALNKVASLVSYVNKSAADSMREAAKSMSTSFQTITFTPQASFGDLWKAWTTGMINDTMGDWDTAIRKKALEFAESRRKANAEQANAQLRQTGVNNIKPTAAKEKKSDAQKAYEAQLKAIRKPEIDHNAALAAANTLLAKGEISQGRYNALIERANDKYSAAIDPLYNYNKQTQKQLDIYEKVGPEATALGVIQQQRQAAIEAGIPWEDKYNTAILERVKALESAKTRSDVMNKIYDDTIGKQQTLIDQQLAYNEAVNKGTISFENYQTQTAKLNVEMANLKLQMGEGSFSDVMTGAMGTVTSNYQNMMTGLSGAFGTFFSSFTDGFASSIGQAIIQGDSLTESLSNVARSVTQELITALVKLGIQYLINSTMATTSLATTTATSTAAAAATTAAWTPAAAAMSIATFGAAAVAGTAAMLTGVGSIEMAMTAMSTTAAVAGYEQGGYTGNGGRSEIAGVVHGQEFVTTADQTSRNPKTLQAIQNGANVDSLLQNQNNAGSGGGVTIQFLIQNDVDVNGTRGDSDEDGITEAMEQAATYTQNKILDSIRRNGTWASAIKAVR